VWVCFGCITESSWPDFQLCLLRWCSGPKKSLKFDRNIFQSYWRQTIRNAPQTVFWCKTKSSALDLQLCLLRDCSGLPEPRKVVKIRPKFFSNVLTWNDKNCTPNNVDMFHVENRVIQARFSTLAAPVVPGPGKVIKIRPKHFSVVLMENDKNCTQNSVGMFRVENRIHRARFSNLPTPVVLAPGKVSKIQLKHFSTVLTGNDKNWTTNCVGMCHKHHLNMLF